MVTDLGKVELFLPFWAPHFPDCSSRNESNGGRIMRIGKCAVAAVIARAQPLFASVGWLFAGAREGFADRSHGIGFEAWP